MRRVWRPVLAGLLLFGSPTSARAVEEGETIEVLPGATAPLDLDACLQVALDSHPDLQRERERRGELLGQAVQARAEAFPILDLNANWSRGRDPSFALDESFGGGDDADGFGSFFGAIADSLGLGGFDDSGFSFLPDPADIPAQSFWRAYAEAYWELRPTRVRNAVRAASVALRQQDAALRDTEHRAVEHTLQAYHAVVLAAEQVAAVESELVARRESLEITRRRHLLDLSTPLDTLQAAVSLANLVPDLRRAEQGLRTAGQDLNLALGRDPLTPLSVVVRFPLEHDPIDEATALRLAVDRPEVETRELQSELLRAQRSAQRAQNHPYLTLEGSYGYVGRDTGTLFDEGHDTWRASVTFTVPLWDGFLTKGRVRSTEAAIRRSEHGVGHSRRAARSEVLTGLDRLRTARANLEAADLNRRMAEDASTQVSLRYELGKADQLEVLNAQAARFAARTNLVRARYEVLTTTATLKRAMGLSPALSWRAALRTAPPEESR